MPRRRTSTCGPTTPSIITLEGGGTTAGTFTFPAGASLNAPQLTALVNDGLYFTVNSQNFQLPVSELAGNIVYPVTTIPAVSLSGNQEVPPVNAPVSSGTGNLTVNLGTGKISGSIAFNTPSSLADRAHIHQGFAGVNGPTLISSAGWGTPSTSGTWTRSSRYLPERGTTRLVDQRQAVSEHSHRGQSRRRNQGADQERADELTFSPFKGEIERGMGLVSPAVDPSSPQPSP